MAGPAFDPNGAVRFDLRRGAASDARGERLVLVPASALSALGEDALARIGDALGRACGARLAERLGGDAGVRATQLEVVVAHLAGELGVAGIGAVHVERWGRAMVAVVENAGVENDAFAGAVLAGALSAAAGRDVAAASLGREGNVTRYFLGSATTAERVRGLVAGGHSHSAVLAAVQGGAS